MVDGAALDRSQTLPARSLPSAVLSEGQVSLTRRYILLEHPPHAQHMAGKGGTGGNKYKAPCPQGA